MDFTWYLLGVAVVFIGVAASIALHEIGHLIPAKIFGVKVTQYMIGFGPTVFSKKKGETEYGFKALPLGGYIAMIGMFPPKKPGDRVKADSTGFWQSMVDQARESSAETVSVGEEHRAFYRLPVWKRIIVMLGGPLMNLILGILFIGILLVGFGLPAASTTIGQVNECVLPSDASRNYCLNSDTAAPAAIAGVKPGDQVIEFAGTKIEDWLQLSLLIRQTTTPTNIVVLRDGAELTLPITPITMQRQAIDEKGAVVLDANGDYVLKEVGFLGFVSQQQRVQQPVSAVIPFVADNVVRVAEVIVNLPQRMMQVAQAAFGSEDRDVNGPISVVGVGRIAGEISGMQSIPLSEKLAGIIGILGSLNLALFAFNLIPLPPLDGGHIAGALWEGLKRGWAKLRGKADPGPVDTAKLMPVTMTVAVLLLVMGGLLIYADIVKPISLL